MTSVGTEPKRSHQIDAETVAGKRHRRRTSRPHAAKLFKFDRDFGVRLVAGADEAGRGCLAGPLVAAAVMFDCEALFGKRLGGLRELNDSKRCSEAARERLYPLILSTAKHVVVVSRSPKTIDSRGLHRTNIAALEAALRGVLATAEETPECLVDGFKLPGLGHSHKAVIGGDRTSAAIAAASVIAKVTRDRLMRELDLEHPGWGFAQHVGYATRSHREAIRELGVSRLHRLSFQSLAYEQLALGDMETLELASA